MTVIRCSVLGSPHVERDGEDVTIRSERQRALLVALVAGEGETLSVDRLTEAIWPDRPPADPAAAVQTHVSRLRRLLGGDAILTEAAGYRLNTAAVTTDLAEFLIGSQRALAEVDTDPAAALVELESALSSWRGAPFDGFAEREIVRPVAVRCSERRQQVEEAVVEAHLALGDTAGAVARAEEIAARDPLRERSTALLMRSLYASGRATDALDMFRRYRTRVGEELGIEPSQSLRDLESAILRHELPAPASPAGRGARTDADRARPRPEATIPSPLTSFVGRDRDVAAIRELLSRHRVVSILGPGGVGKTRLAQHASLSLVDEYADGVWWCDLTAERPDDVADTIAAALGVQHRSGTSVVERLVEFLRPRRTLVVLDNCDRVVDTVAAVVERVARQTRETDFLCSSREALAIEAEHRWLLQPLDTDGTASGGHEEAPAFELFVERARAVVPGFTPTPAQADQIREICARLDGLPLGIELAAARMSTMTVAEIAAGLDARFELLMRHRRSTGRQRSLRATFDWSFDLLDEPTRRVFVSASVFSAPFTAESMQAVSLADDSPAGPALFDLVERSLVQRSAGADDTRPATYRLLETVRRYGQERLTAAERTRLEQRHARHVVDQARGWQGQLEGADEAGAASAATSGWSEVRAAHRHLFEAGDLDLLLEMWSALFWFLWGRMRSDAFLLAEACARRAAVEAPDDPRLPRVASTAGMGAWQRGDFACASELARIGHVAAGDDAVLGTWCDEVDGDCALLQGSLDDAQRAYDAAVEHAEQAGGTVRRVVMLADSALPFAYRGQHEAASTRALEALELARQVGQPTGLAMAHYCAGEVLLDVEPDASRRHLEQSIAIARANDLAFVHGIALVSAVTLQGRSGDVAGALARYPTLVEHWARAGNWSQQWTTLRNLAELLARAGHDRAAAVLLGASRAPAEGGAVFGADEERLTRARETIVGRLGEDATIEAATSGAALDGPRAVRFARDTLAEILAGGGSTRPAD